MAKKKSAPKKSAPKKSAPKKSAPKKPKGQAKRRGTTVRQANTLIKRNVKTLEGLKKKLKRVRTAKSKAKITGEIGNARRAVKAARAKLYRATKSEQGKPALKGNSRKKSSTKGTKTTKTAKVTSKRGSTKGGKKRKK